MSKSGESVINSQEKKELDVVLTLILTYIEDNGNYPPSEFVKYVFNLESIEEAEEILNTYRNHERVQETLKVFGEEEEEIITPEELMLIATGSNLYYEIMKNALEESIQSEYEIGKLESDLMSLLLSVRKKYHAVISATHSLDIGNKGFRIFYDKQSNFVNLLLSIDSVEVYKKEDEYYFKRIK